MTSFNHYALGAVAHWMHTTIAGLAPAEAGYRRIRFAPQPGGGLTWARAEHESPYGRVAIDWHLDRDLLKVRTETPFGTTAELSLPDGSMIELAPGIAELKMPIAEGGAA